MYQIKKFSSQQRVRHHRRKNMKITEFQKKIKRYKK